MWSRRAFLRTTGVLGTAALTFETKGLEAIAEASAAVAGQSPEGRSRSGDCCQAVGHDPEHGITAFLADLVVDDAEVVEVDHCQAERTAETTGAEHGVGVARREAQRRAVARDEEPVDPDQRSLGVGHAAILAARGDAFPLRGGARADQACRTRMIKG